MQWSEEDRTQMRARGIDEDEINRQLELFEANSLTLKVVRPATLNDGIRQLDEATIEHYVNHFESQKGDLKLVKFVPASGAATRMFKHLFTWNKPESSALVEEFKRSVMKLPFADLLSDCFTAHGESLSVALKNGAWDRICELILEPNGLGYGYSPKGLVPFHRYQDHVRTAFEEHLVESASYGSVNGNTQIHFTISKESNKEIPLFLSQRTPMIESDLSTQFEIAYSEQSPSTDTIAVTVDYEPLRDEEGQLVFRPGGHGALIRNLNELEADVVFIKNIDNVVPERELPVVKKYKQALAGLLLQLVDERKRIVDALNSGASMADLRKELQTIFELDLDDSCLATAEEMERFLRKPIRVCGMVPNTGEPGGGPYWVKDVHGNERLQIVEKGQIDMDDDDQKAIFESSTHFNPVDIVCYVRDFDGAQLDLHEFVDPGAAFISTKFNEGLTLKALEHPGLWNGGMSDWLTVFVEVPSQTFAPVKNVNDLFRPCHQA